MRIEKSEGESGAREEMRRKKGQNATDMRDRGAERVNL